MRLGYKKFKEIKKWYGSSDFEIGYFEDGLSLRFGYWKDIDLDGLKKVLPSHLTIVRKLVDECEFGSPLYNYEVSYNPFK
tara:strand:- start:162 stop:401 length:240 start_codon:yes stop_codon:yes gene_type:complete